ncbi:MAG: carboxypeptidase-like regulatory domain-containing protein [Myxococcota bacterium]
MRLRFLLLLALAACSSFGDPPLTVENLCAGEGDCASGVCDPEGFCVTTEGVDLEIAVRVIPSAEDPNPTLSSWTSQVFVPNGEARDFTLPTHVDVVGLLRWQESRVPAEVIFTRPGLEGRSEERVRVSTLSEPTRIGTMEADFVARLEAGQMYDVEVRPTAETMPGSDTPWRRTLPPIRLLQVTTPDTVDGRDVVWPVEIRFPPLDSDCGGGTFAGCGLLGQIVDADDRPEAGLQVRAVEVETGAVVSSTALTDEEGAFRITTAPDAGEYVLRVSGGEGRELFPTVSIDPALLPGEARIRVPAPDAVTYRGRVEGEDGAPLAGATLSFASENVFDETVMLRGSFGTSTTTDAEGEFEVDLLAGTYEIVVSPTAGQFSVLAEELRIVPSATGAPISGQLFVAPERARFGGTIRTAREELVPGVSVEAVALGVGGDDLPRAVTFNRSSDTASDTGGQFLLRLDLGSYDLFVKPAAETNYGWVVLPGHEVGSLDATVVTPFELAAPVPVRGTLRNDDGSFLVGAEVRVFGRSTDSERFVELGRGRTDDQGQYRVLLSPRIASSVR